MKKLLNWIRSFFTRENIGIIWRVLFTTANESVKNTIHDHAIQQKAFDLALSLLKKDMTGDEKKDAFNKAMKEYLKGIGAEIGTSTLNTIRELALDAVKKSNGDGGGDDGCSDGSCTIKSIVLLLAAGLMAFGAMADTEANVVTDVVYETHVRFDTYPVTNGSYEVYGGTLTTNRVYDTPRYVWRNGGLVLITNYVDTVTAGTTTSTVYNVEWRMRPNYYPVAVTNVYTNIFVNGINVRR